MQNPPCWMQEENKLIIYKNILEKLKEAGYNTTRIRKEKILSESTLTKLRNNEPINLETLDKICELTGADIPELIERR